jgi:hypothetical protein
MLQGALRCASRMNVEGVARASHIYITHQKSEAIEMLMSSMNGLNRVTKEPTLRPIKNGPKRLAIQEILDVLEGLREEDCIAHPKAHLKVIAEKHRGKPISKQLWSTWLKLALEFDADENPWDPWETDRGRGRTIVRSPTSAMFEDEGPDF